MHEQNLCEFTFLSSCLALTPRAGMLDRGVCRLRKRASMEQRKSFAVSVCTPSLLSHNQTKGRLHAIPETMARHKAALLGNSAHAIADKAKRPSMTAYSILVLVVPLSIVFIHFCQRSAGPNKAHLHSIHIRPTLRCRPFEFLYQSAVLELLPQQHKLPLINLRSLLRDSCGREICPRIPKTVAVPL